MVSGPNGLSDTGKGSSDDSEYIFELEKLIAGSERFTIDGI
jgi:hypothetical protein